MCNSSNLKSRQTIKKRISIERDRRILKEKLEKLQRERFNMRVEMEALRRKVKKSKLDELFVTHLLEKHLFGLLSHKGYNNDKYRLRGLLSHKGYNDD